MTVGSSIFLVATCGFMVLFIVRGTDLNFRYNRCLPMTRNIVTQSRHRGIHNLEKEDGVLYSDEWTPTLPSNFDKLRHLIVELQNIHTIL